MSQAMATGGSETTVPQDTALVASASGFSDALSSAFQAAWKMAANSTRGKTANGTKRSLSIRNPGLIPPHGDTLMLGMAQRTARKLRREVAPADNPTATQSHG